MEEIFLDWKNLKKETTDTTIKDIRNIFSLEKENKAIKERILRDIRKILRIEKENYYLKDLINILTHGKFN